MGKKKAAKKKATSAPTPSKRRGTRTSVTAEGRRKILQGVLERRPIAEIADSLGVSHKTVYYTWTKTIQPLLRSGEFHAAEVQLAGLDNLERVCWDKFWGSDEEAVRSVSEAVLEALKDDKRVSAKAAAAIAENIQVKSPNQQLGYLQLILAVCKERARLTGVSQESLNLYLNGNGGEFRVAGASREEVDREMIGRLMTQMADRKLLKELQEGE